jgi:methylated-DNA-[protein]-cysteine S-methyltransferase
MTTHRYWGRIESRFGHFAAWVDGKGTLLRFHLRSKGAAHVDPEAVHDEEAIADIRRQIAEYEAGTRKRFDVVRKAEGSEFQHRVWDALWEIPYGVTTSYGAVAKSLGLPNAARAVGLANGQNPIAIVVPCHRVIGADGRLTGFGGGLPMKKALLEHEAAHSERADDLFAAAR